MRRLVIVALLAALCVSHVSAQLSGPVPQSGVTFRSEATFVEVHAIVTDARGAFVGDLTADDFEILENGKPQRPSAFSLVNLPIERPATALDGSGPIEPDVRSTSRTFDGRIYLLVLDDLHTNVTRTQFVREAARKFVRQYFGTGDLAAVVYTSGRQTAGQELTSSQRLLLAAIDRFQGQKLPSAGAEKLAVHVRQVENETVLADEAQPIRSQEGLQKAESIRDPYDDQRALNAKRALQTVEDVSNWMREVQGRRKALLLFSEGIDYDIYQPFTLSRGASSSALVAEAREATAAAQRANVNIYGIDPRGLNQFGELIDVHLRSDYPQLEYGTFRGALHELRLAQESLLSLSDETGGLAIVNAGDVLGGLARVVLDNSRYYLLGYNSDPKQWSRAFMKIEVRVKRPGVEVRARRGFMPPDPKAVTRAREAEVKAGTTPALKAALSKPVPVGDLPLRVFAAPFRGTRTQGSLFLALEFDGDALMFSQRDGRFNEHIEVSIVAADERAKVQGGDRQEFDLRLQPQTYERVRGGGVRLLSRLPLPPGRYQVHVGAHERTGGTSGTVPYDVEIPDYPKVPFALSGVLLTSTRADAFVTPNPDPLLKQVLPAPPVVTRQFASGETLTTYAEVYGAPRDVGAVTMTHTVFELRDGRKVLEASDRRVPETPDVGQGFTTTLRLAEVAAGRYVLRVEARSAIGGHVARQDIPFDVR